MRRESARRTGIHFPANRLGRDTQRVGRTADIEILCHGIRCGPECRQEPVQRPTTSGQRSHPSLAIEQLKLALEDVNRVGDDFGQCCGTTLDHHRVRILTLR